MTNARQLAMCLTLLACAGDTDAPGRMPAPPAPPAALPLPAAPAAALASTFAPELVGAMVPVAPRAGDYAMALTLTFETRPTMEMRLSQRRTGSMTMTLAADGTARACLGSRRVENVYGQYHYEPPERVQHRKTDDARLVGLGGQWTVVDGVAAIQLDRVSWWSCDLARATKLATPFAELRCVGAGPTQLVPAGSLACEATTRSQLGDLGLPMTSASRNVPPSPMHSSPEGRNLILGAPGLIVEVTQDARAMTPAIALRAGAVRLVEDDYRPRPPPPP